MADLWPIAGAADETEQFGDVETVSRSIGPHRGGRGRGGLRGVRTAALRHSRGGGYGRTDRGHVQGPQQQYSRLVPLFSSICPPASHCILAPLNTE